MTELQKTNALLKSLLELTLVQHQDLIWALTPDNPGAWFRRLNLCFELQNRHKLFSAEQMALVEKNDLKDMFRCMPQLRKAWPGSRRYFTKDFRKFIDKLVADANAHAQKQKERSETRRKKK